MSVSGSSSNSTGAIIQLIVLGAGGVGRAFIRQILSGRSVHQRLYNIHFQLQGIADSSGTVLAPQNEVNGLSDDIIKEVLEWKTAAKSLSTFRIHNFSADNHGLLHAATGYESKDKSASSALGRTKTIIVDASASNSTVNLLSECWRYGVNSGIVLANKKPLTSDPSLFDDYFSPFTLTHSKLPLLKYSSTVGAGTPFVNSVQRLLASGQTIQRLVGTFSGTLGFVVSGLESGKKFSDLVYEAAKLGYTEPDPRDDLGGVDVARKALILSRTLGLKLSMKDVQIEALYPDRLAGDSVSVEQFLKDLPSLDDDYAKKVNSAASEGKVLRYVAEIIDSKVSVGLKSVLKSSPLGALKGTQNLLELYSSIYNPAPLVIQGAGAGAEVTAAGMLTDAVEIALTMAARP